MSVETRLGPERPNSPSPLQVLVSLLSTLFVIGGILAVTILAMTPVGQSVAASLTKLFATDSVQLWWYVTRAAGIVAYLLLWFSTVLGLGVTSKSFDRMLDRMFTYDFHEFISLLSIGFVLLHIIVLMLDRYLPYTLLQVLVPFLSPYRPLWVGFGAISFYIILLVTVTFYLRKKTGQKAFRAIHVLSLVGYLGVTLHGLYAGTDAVLPAMKLLYQGTGLVVLFLTVYWLVLAAFRRAEMRRKSATADLPGKRRAGARR